MLLLIHAIRLTLNAPDSIAYHGDLFVMVIGNVLVVGMKLNVIEPRVQECTNVKCPPYVYPLKVFVITSINNDCSLTRSV